MKSGLVLVKSDYPADKARALADEGFFVAVCDTMREAQAAIKRYMDEPVKCTRCCKPMEYIPGDGQWPARWVCTRRKPYSNDLCDTTILEEDV